MAWDRRDVAAPQQGQKPSPNDTLKPMFSRALSAGEGITDDGIRGIERAPTQKQGRKKTGGGTADGFAAPPQGSQRFGSRLFLLLVFSASRLDPVGRGNQILGPCNKSDLLALRLPRRLSAW